eukprot:gnl/TRDRNA2_/TRDRNA2_176635_c0_seq1.p1 gnl/TRDRNA2_/TRDRNA2_176635_c0~~gnl/TRDRNA2_/TRDRNA2_176635_c0_seq1.p1  ORF type:complete len:281 (-),score=-22.72 gnl/TRDRNA2_/TRDRNA2_176635_c0_seq1:122-964(-)
MNLLLNDILTKSYSNTRTKMEAIRILQELFLSKTLPDRKLYFINHNPALQPKLQSSFVNDRLIFPLYLEESIKQRYLVFIKAITELSLENTKYLKEAAIKTAYMLLVNKPEKEFNLIALIVKKMTDSSQEIATKVTCLIICFVKEHPKMMQIVIEELEKIVIGKKVSDIILYRIVLLMNQFKISYIKNTPSLAAKFICLYFYLLNLVCIPRNRTKRFEYGTKYISRIKSYEIQNSSSRISNLIPESSLKKKTSLQILPLVIIGIKRIVPFLDSSVVNYLY